LAAVLSPGKPIAFLDDAPAGRVASLKGMQIVIYTVTDGPFRVADVSIPLERWGEDQVIEYLLAIHREHCSALVARVRALPERNLLGGNPELWRIVLDRIARDESAIDVREILRSQFANHLTDPSQLRAAKECAAAELRGMPELAQYHRSGLVSLGAEDGAL
jgi:hypothetical protein